MSRVKKDKLRVWLAVAGVSLGLHYFMLILAQLIISGDISPAALLSLMKNRLTVPGDAVRYLDIAQNGYVTEGENAINLVFYPLYPLLVRLLGTILGNFSLAGVFISQLSFAGAAVLFYELILLDSDSPAAWRGVLLLNLYPYSMFVMGVFTEGLFLLLTIGCMYALRRERFVWAGMIGFLAALTRVQGMLLIFPAVYELLSLRLGKDKRPFRWSGLSVLLIPAGFGVYLCINWALHGNAFQFLAYEAGEPWYQSTAWIGPNIAQQYQMGVDYPALRGIIYAPQICLYFVVLLTLFLGLRRKERMSHLLYGGVYLGFTYLSGWMISGGRYLLCCFPAALILARQREGLAQRLTLLGMGLLFFAYSLFYLMGYAIM